MSFGGGAAENRRDVESDDGSSVRQSGPDISDLSTLPTRELLKRDSEARIRVVGGRVLKFFADLNEWAMANVDEIRGVRNVLWRGNFEIADDQIRCVARINPTLSARQRLALFSALADLRFGECKGNFGENASIAITMPLGRFDKGFQPVTAVADGVAAAAKSTAGT